MTVPCTHLQLETSIVLTPQVTPSSISCLPSFAVTWASSFVKHLCVLQAESPAAREWQLSWSCPEASGLKSRAILQLMRVNPGSSKQFSADVTSSSATAEAQLALEALLQIPGPLPAQWAVEFSAGWRRLLIQRLLVRDLLLFNL